MFEMTRTNITVSDAVKFLKDQVSAELKSFHEDEEGMTTVEVLMLLFVAAVVIFALSKGGQDVMTKTSTYINKLFSDVKINW